MLWLETVTHLLLMLGDDVTGNQNCGRDLHPYLASLGPYRRPSADMVELTTGLAGRAPGFMGHDCCDRWSATKKIVAAAGLPETWGICQACQGHGDVGTPEERQAREDWQGSEPPSGDGWQLWETTTAGSPISPIFATAEELAVWISQNPCGFEPHGRNVKERRTNE